MPHLDGEIVSWAAIIITALARADHALHRVDGQIVHDCAICGGARLDDALSWSWRRCGARELGHARFISRSSLLYSVCMVWSSAQICNSVS